MTRKFTFLLMALLALAGFKSWGQTEIQIGNGTQTQGTVPFYNYYKYSYAQMLYLGSEIGQSGTITSISFDLSRATSLNGMKFDIYMKCVSKDSYSSVTDWVSVTDDDLVCTTTLNSIPSGWVTFTLDNPFVYDKTQGNLMIAFDNNTGSYTSSSGYAQFHYTTTSPKNTCLYYYQDSGDINPSNPSAQYSAASPERPNIKIMLEPSTSCPKPTGLTASNVTATGATISWTDNDAESYDVAYGVASTFDLSNPTTYTLRDGLNTTSVQLSDLTAETVYKYAVKAHCSDEDESNWSKVAVFFATNCEFVTLNNGTDHAQYEYMPFYGPYVHNSDTKSEIIYPASDLQSLTGKNINNLTFYASVSDHDFGSDAWDVYVKEVNYTNPGQTGWAYTNDYASMSKVYSGPLSINDHKMYIILDESFVYNSQNLMICFQQTSHASGTNADISWDGVNPGGTNGSDMRSRGGYTGVNSGNASSAFLPKTTFGYIPSVTYTVNLTHPEVGGTIDANPKADVAAGTTVTLSATPATGYEFGEWTVINSTTSQEITVTDNQFEMPESDVTVTATFEALVPHTVTIADGIQHGTVRLFDGDPTEYMAGETVSLEVLPAEGYFYPNKDEITVTDANGNNIDVTITDATNYSFIMPNSNVTVFAVFNLYYGVQVDTEIVGGSIDVTLDFEHSITGIPFFTEGTDVYFIPIPGDDYEYAEQSVEVYEWDLEQHEIGDPVAVDFNSGFAHIAMPASDIFVTATFNRTKYNITQQIANPTEGGNFNIENAEHILVGTSVVISDIAPSWDYQFASVTVTRNDNQTTVETYKYNDDYVFTMPNSDVTVTVNFEAIPYYDVTINEPEHGSAYINGAQSYHAGDEVVLTANPDEGYIISATDITITPAEGEPFHPAYVEYTGYVFNMPASDVTITAAFREIQTYTINYYVNGELEDTAPCKENEAIDIYTYTPYVYGVNFEGWGVAPIGTYVTEKPTIIGEEEYPTHNYDLHAVFSYSEDVPATSKDGETWKKITDVNELTDGDQFVIVGSYLGYPRTMTNVYYVDGDDNYSYNKSTTTVQFDGNGDIANLPDNTAIFTYEFLNDNNKCKLHFTDSYYGETTLSHNGTKGIAPFDVYNWYSYDMWKLEKYSGGVSIKHATSNGYLGIESGNDYRFVADIYNSDKALVYKKSAAMVTTNYYMTSVLTNGEIAENTTAKNIIITNLTSINVKDGATLTMDANGLFRNKNEIMGFVFEDGTQFYYTGTENVNAIFKKEIAAYEDEYSRDGYYLIANPTDNDYVSYLDSYTYDLYTFDPEMALEWQNKHDDVMPSVEQEIGYLYASSENVTLQFSGNLIPAGSTSKSLTYAAAGEGIDFPGFNLIGNPFACNAYVSGYNFYTMVGGELQTAVTSATIAPCEGFFVEATATGQSVTLSTTAPAPASLLNITVSQDRGNVIDRAIVNFNDNNDLHKFMMNPAHTNLSIAKGGETFAAISTEAEGELPVNFKAEKDGTYTISVNTENVEANYLHLIDNLTGMDTDLLSTPSYTFNATTSDYASRFKLVFSMNNDNEDMSQANSFAYINNGEIIISNEGRATLQVIDVMGRIISSEEIHGECRISTNGLTAGLYILNLNGMTQKIVVR